MDVTADLRRSKESDSRYRCRLPVAPLKCPSSQLSLRPLARGHETSLPDVAATELLPLCRRSEQRALATVMVIKLFETGCNLKKGGKNRRTVPK